jgi:hypothetical protein
VLGRVIADLRLPLGAVELYKFTYKVDDKTYDPSREYDPHKKSIHNLELRLDVQHPLNPVARSRTFHMIATDGFRLMHFWWGAQEGDRAFGFPIYLDGRNIRKLMSQFPSPRHLELEYRLVKVGRHLVLKADDEFSEVVNKGDELENPFPDYKKLLPKPTSGEVKTCPFGVNGDYVGDFVDYIKEQGRLVRSLKKRKIEVDYEAMRFLDDNTIVFHYEEPPNLAMRITANRTLPIGKVEYILMPVTVNQ